jgi:hypothetical protein
VATGATIVGGIKTVGGIAGAINSNRKSEGLMKDQTQTWDRAISEMGKYFGEANLQGEQALEYAQQLMADWEQTFGGIEENLSDYYNNLDPEKYAQEYKTNLYENIDKQVAQLNDSLASSGLQSSGMAAQTAKEAAFAKATGSAQADLAAEDKVNAMKQGFVNTGANRYANAANATTNAYGNLANINMTAGSNIGSLLGSQANMYGDQAKTYGKDAAGFLKAGLGSAPSFIDTLLGK